MKTNTKKTILGIFLLSLMTISVIAIDTYSGETEIIEIDEDYEYYSIVGNSTPIEINVTSNGSHAKIDFGKYINDSFELVFFDKEKKVVKKYSSSGGGGGGTTTVYENQTEFVEVPNYIPKEQETSEKECPEDETNETEVVEVESETGWIAFFALSALVLLGFILYFLSGGSKNETNN